MSEEQTHTGRPAGPEKEKWRDFQLAEQQKTPERMENAAKAIGGIISITLTLLLSLLSDKDKAFQLEHFSLVVILWLGAVVLAFFVIFPFPYRYSTLSINSFRKAHHRAGRVKYVLLVISAMAYLVGMGFLVAAVL